MTSKKMFVVQGLNLSLIVNLFSFFFVKIVFYFTFHMWKGSKQECNRMFFMRQARAQIIFYFNVFCTGVYVCVSGYVCMSASLTTMPVYVTDIKCLAYFWRICTNCQAYVYLFVGHLWHFICIMLFFVCLFATGTLCLPTQLLFTCSIYKNGTKYWGDQM